LTISCACGAAYESLCSHENCPAWGRREEEREKERRKGSKKEKEKRENFPNLEISGKKNKR
jgi:hypothetical protein